MRPLTGNASCYSRGSRLACAGPLSAAQGRHLVPRNPLREKRDRPELAKRPFQMGHSLCSDDHDRQRFGIAHLASQKLQTLARSYGCVQEHDSPLQPRQTLFDVSQRSASDHPRVLRQKLPLKLGSPSRLLLKDDDRRRRGGDKSGRRNGQATLTFIHARILGRLAEPRNERLGACRSRRQAIERVWTDETWS